MATERSDFSTASAAQSDAAWYFIDSNRAYRGPISGETLHFLYSTNAITKQTYVFTEKLSSSRQWTRIRKIDWLYKSLEQPTASSRAASQRATAQPVKEAAGEGAGQEAGEAPASPASKSPSPASPPRTLGSAPAKGAAGMLPAGAAAGASLSERLIGRGSAAKGATGAATSAEPSRTMSLAAGKRWLGLGRGKGSSRFGVKLDEARLGDDGVPEVLQELRTLLMARKGHRNEGIFRVSPATSALQASRALVEAGQTSKVSDLESVAQLIKVWFRELPESVFGADRETGIVAPIVDGDFTTGAGCYEAMQGLPEPRRSTVRWLLELIGDVCRYESENRMTAQSMIIVFAPNLIVPRADLDPLSALQVNQHVVRFMELLFGHWNEVRGPATRITASTASPQVDPP